MIQTTQTIVLLGGAVIIGSLSFGQTSDSPGGMGTDDAREPVQEQQILESTSSQKEESPLARLDRIAGPETDRGSLVEDIRFALEAEAYEESEEFSKASESYFKALGRAEGEIAALSLDGWIRSHAASLGAPAESASIAKKLLLQAKKSPAKSYLKKRKLIGLEAFEKRVEAVAKDYVIGQKDEPEPTRGYPPAPKKTGIPKNDPTLEETAKSLCKGSGPVPSDWSKWADGLPASTHRYWQGLVFDCQDSRIKALKFLRKSVEDLRSTKKLANLRVRAAYRSVKLERKIGSRPVAAKTYLSLIDFWSAPGVTPKSLGFTPAKFQLEKINDLLWAARYQSLVGDYAAGRKLAGKALKAVSKSLKSRVRFSKKERKQIADYHAEAYIVLANRIAWEEGKRDAAADHMKKATRIKKMSEKMEESVLWYAGLFSYLAKDTAFAAKTWEKLQKQTEDEGTKARCYFWLARAYMDLGQSEKAEEYSTLLNEEYPLDFYAVVGSGLARIETPRNWTSQFANVDELRAKFNSRDLEKKIYPQLNSASKRLVTRNSILARAELTKYAKLNVKDLNRSVRRQFKIKKQPEAFIYLARKHGEAGDYLGGIVLTTQLAYSSENFWDDWPEQIFAYYPTPHAKLYLKHALRTNLDRELLLSVTRQESAFNEEAVSPAFAYGLMQIIVPTAKKFAPPAGISKENLKERLLVPEVALGIGSEYLKFLSSHYEGFIPAFLAAYNAGEYAVDRWLEKRLTDDPISWIELMPFRQTRSYVKKVWRNKIIYEYLNTGRVPKALKAYASADSSRRK